MFAKLCRPRAARIGRARGAHARATHMPQPMARGDLCARWAGVGGESAGSVGAALGAALAQRRSRRSGRRQAVQPPRLRRCAPPPRPEAQRSAHRERAVAGLAGIALGVGKFASDRAEPTEASDGRGSVQRPEALRVHRRREARLHGEASSHLPTCSWRRAAQYASGLVVGCDICRPGSSCRDTGGALRSELQSRSARAS